MRERTARRQKERAAAKPAEAQPGFRLKPAWIAAGLCALNLAVYSGVTSHDFIDYDDHLYIYQNPDVAGGLSWASVKWAFTTGYQANWHPLTWLSHMLDVQLFGLNPGPHHAVSLLLHMLSTLLLFFALHRMTGAPGRSAFVAALFAAHPLHVESVAWAAERKDTLSTFFWMATLCAYLWYLRRPGLARYSAMTILFWMGLMSKPMLVTLPFTLLLLDFWPLGRVAAGGGIKAAGPKLVLEKLPLIGLTAISSVITFLVQRDMKAMANLQQFTLPVRLAHTVVAYAVYLGKTIWPVDLAPFYPYEKSLPAATVLLSAVLLAGVSALVIWVGAQRPYAPVGWLWFLGTLVPVIGLVQVGEQAWADRYMYVPLIGLAIIASWGGYDLLGRLRMQNAAPMVAGVITLILAVVARTQSGYWQDSFTTWQHALAVTSNNAFAEGGVGVGLYLRGQTDEAIPHLENAVRLKPDYAEAHANLALALVQKGRYSEAVEHDRAAIKVHPESSTMHANLGLALIRTGDTAEAKEQFNEALRLYPDNPDAKEGLAYLAKGQKQSLP